VSFYPQRTRRWPGLLAALLVGLLVGGASGALLGRASAPSLAERVSELRQETAAVLTRLEVLDIEYPQAVRDGTIVGHTEYDGSLARVENARNAFADLAGDLRVVDPRAHTEATTALDQLARDVNTRADPDRVAADLRQVRAALGEWAPFLIRQ
jgi:hypothetical protein